MPHEQVSVKHACCQKEDSTKHESGSKEKCPCKLSQLKSSIVSEKMEQPPLSWTLVPQIAWEGATLKKPGANKALTISPPNENPSWRSSPRLYERHCALLL